MWSPFPIGPRGWWLEYNLHQGSQIGHEKGLYVGWGRGLTAALLSYSARMSAGQCLQHPWLTNLAEKAKRCNRRLKSQVLLKKYVMRRRWKVRRAGRGWG